MLYRMPFIAVKSLRCCYIGNVFRSSRCLLACNRSGDFRSPSWVYQVRGAATSSSGTTPTEADVLLGMHKWVNEFIVNQKLCPFARSSKYKILVCPSPAVDRGMMEVFVKEVLKLANIPDETELERPNVLVAFPFAEELIDFHHFIEFYYVAVEACGGVAGTFEDYKPRSASMKIQVMPFHPNPAMPINECKAIAESYIGRAPWPVLHALRLFDLKKVRGDDGTLSEHISLRNAATLSAAGVSKLDSMFQACREQRAMQIQKQEPQQVLQTTKPLSPEKMASLEREGVRVDMVNTTTESTRKKPKLKPRHGRKKGRR